MIIAMGIIIGIIIVLYVLYKIGMAGEKSDEDVSSDETLYDVEMQNEKRYLSDEEILNISSKILQCPYISAITKTARELTGEIVQSPIKAEKLVGTVVMMEDYIKNIYISNQMIHIVLGDGKQLHMSGHEKQYMYNEYTCEIVDFYETIEELKPGDAIKVIGVLDRDHPLVTSRPDRIKRAIVLKINYEIIPEVEEFLKSWV